MRASSLANAGQRESPKLQKGSKLKIELLATLCVLGVGVLLGMGISTDGTWLDTADKIASVVSCLVTCAAFVYAWKAYHSWKTPLQLEAYEKILAQLRLFKSAILSPSVMLMMPTGVKTFILGSEVSDVPPEYFKNHCSTALTALKHVTSEIPKDAMLKLNRLDTEAHADITDLQAEAAKIRQRLYDFRSSCDDPDLYSQIDAFALSNSIGESLSALSIRTLELENKLVDAHARII